jgi:FdhD protein
VSLSVNNQIWLTFMCTPTNLDALGIGFLFNENVIRSMQDVASVRVCPGEDNIDVWLNIPVSKPERWKRTSGCSGGRTSIYEAEAAIEEDKPKDGLCLPPAAVGMLMGQLVDSQDLYRKSGGVHTSSVCDGEKLLLIAEDIGRHNTLDKLAGRLLLEHLDPIQRIILTTGRISSEMIQKAKRMGASIVISRTSPTSLSVEMAENCGITMLGYVRGDRFTIYTHPERILSTVPGEPKTSEAK